MSFAWGSPASERAKARPNGARSHPSPHSGASVGRSYARSSRQRGHRRLERSSRIDSLKISARRPFRWSARRLRIRESVGRSQFTLAGSFDCRNRRAVLGPPFDPSGPIVGVPTGRRFVMVALVRRESSRGSGLVPDHSGSPGRSFTSSLARAGGFRCRGSRGRRVFDETRASPRITGRRAPRVGRVLAAATSEKLGSVVGSLGENPSTTICATGAPRKR
jgi:hypothetical protein